MDTRCTLADYQSLAELRHQIRMFMHSSEIKARAAGLEPRQHELMLALRGLPADRRPTMGQLAERLQIRQHSTVELVNRLVASGCVRRWCAGARRREVLVLL